MSKFEQIDITEYLISINNDEEIKKVEVIENNSENKYKLTYYESKYNIIDYDNKYRPNVMETIRFIHLLADKLGISYEYAKPQFDAIIDTITDGLVKDKKVTFRGFGTLKVVHRKEKVGYNYRHNKFTPIPAHEEPAFYPSDELKELINREREDN